MTEDKKNQLEEIAVTDIVSYLGARLFSMEEHIRRKRNQLTKAKEIIKKFSEFVNNEAEDDPEYPEYSQGQADLRNEICEQAEQFLKKE